MTSEPPLFLAPFKNLSESRAYHALFEPSIQLGLSQMDHSAAAYGMEASHPFLDLPLIEFFLAIPSEIKMEGGYRKNFIQRALAEIVPTPVKLLDNNDCFIPYIPLEERKILEMARLSSYLGNPDGRIFEYLDFSEVQKMIDPANLNRSFNFPVLWRLARLECWLRRNF